MSVCTRLPGHARPTALALITLTALTLAACGGGGSDDPPDGGSGGPAPSINALAGDWVQRGCARIGAQSFRKILRASLIDQTTIDYSEGVLTFNNTECAGPSQRAGPSWLGTVTYARSAVDQALAAHWGEFRTVTGTRFGAIWTLRPTHLLCLLGDEIPSNQPSLSSVSSSTRATRPA